MYLAFILTCIVIELTPGPNMTYLAVLSSHRGRRAGFSVVAGVAVGLSAIGIASLLGVATLLLENPALFQILRWGGVCYLLWLAWETWRGEDVVSHPSGGVVDAGFFRRGFITNVLNPKAVVFYITVFPSYGNVIDDGWPYIVFLLFIYIMIATIIHVAIVLLGDYVRQWLENERRLAGVCHFFSILLVLTALWFGWSTQKILG